MMQTLTVASAWLAREAGRAWKRAVPQAAPERAPAMPPVFVRACVVNEHTRQRRTPVRAAFLSPYVAQTLVEDVQHTGSGTRLQIVVNSARRGAVRSVYRAFARLRRRGIEVEVLRSGAYRHRKQQRFIPHRLRRANTANTRRSRVRVA